MAAVIWVESALQDLDAIADYIALDDPQAAKGLILRVFRHVEQLEEQPESGSRPPRCAGRVTARSSSRLAAFSIAMTALKYSFFT